MPKKTEIIDGDIELITPEVEKRMFKEKINFLIQKDKKFLEKVSNTPIEDLISEIEHTIQILFSLIKDIDKESYKKYAVNKSDYYKGLVKIRENVPEDLKKAYLEDLNNIIENLEIIKINLKHYKFLLKKTKQ